MAMLIVIPLLSSFLLLINAQQSPTPVSKLCSDKANDSIFENFQDNLSTFLQASVYYYDIGSSGFYNATVGEAPDTVYGLVLCGGDVAAEECRRCAKTATQEILQQCPYSKGAILWYSHCLLRYSGRPFFSSVDVLPFICSTKGLSEKEPENFYRVLGDAFQSIVFQAASRPLMYAEARVNVSRFLGLNGRAECTRDLSKEDCSKCLQRVVSYVPECRRRGKPGGVLAPSCSISYELHRLGRRVEPPQAPFKPKVVTKGGKGKLSTLTVSINIISAVLLLLLISCFLYCVIMKKRIIKDNRNVYNENQLFYMGGKHGDDHSREFIEDVNQIEIEFPLISLDLLYAATRKFSAENKLGEGGFGPVYKGTLMGGMEIAVKRLSRRSSQGLEEFKTEASLIAKLQHRNLVRLFGCCIEAGELLLVYEYLPNKSLDIFLFDSRKGAQLDWGKRFSIISGIARGLQYLHEDSHLTIIHRDLKASNVLLDHEMNPKISDFGIARILGGNQNEASADIVVGTFGYLAPEYATEGLFSAKSDVFSFGVLMLEIISGKKNGILYPCDHDQSLLSLAWMSWSTGQRLELMDPLLAQSCTESEVLKCLHIALLCVQENPANRPTMSSVVVMLGSSMVTALPLPVQPSLYLDLCDHNSGSIFTNV